jgi:hypothetical protein
MVMRRQWCNGTLCSWQNDLGATAQAARSGLVVRAAAKAGNWLPGETLLQKAGYLDVMWCCQTQCCWIVPIRQNPS